MKTILVPFNFSTQSENCARFGLELAFGLKARLLLLHVTLPASLSGLISLPLSQPDTHSGSLTEVLAMEMHRYVEELNRYKEKNGYASIFIQSRMVVGKSAEAILETALREKPSFVVMSTQGASNVWDRVVGSVTVDVARRISCPLWILHKAVRLVDLCQWVYFADFQGEEVSCLKQVIRLGEQLLAQVKVVHISPMAEEEFLLAETITDMFETSYASQCVMFENIRYESVTGGIEDYVRNHSPDVIVLAHRSFGLVERLFHRSTIKKLSQTIQRPLLIVHK